MATPKTALTSVSWPDEDLLNRAKARARALGLTFSGYVNQVVRQNLSGGTPFVLAETPPEYGREKPKGKGSEA